MDGREHHLFILASAILPLVGVATAVVLLWNEAVGWSDLVVFAIMYVIAGLGVSTGYHRLLAHRAFKTYRPIALAFATAGAMAGQGPPLIWTAHHRRHHRVADKPGDPHSPYGDLEPGIKGALKGLWHAHMGWLFNKDLTSDPMRYCPDLARDADMRIISRHFLWFVAAGDRAAGADRLGADRRVRDGLPDRHAVGRPGPLLRQQPHHVRGQLGGPLLRLPPVRHRGRVAQRLLAGPAVLRRGLAQQPPRLPPVVPARHEVVRARRQRHDRVHPGEAPTWPGTSCASTRTGCG